MAIKKKSINKSYGGSLIKESYPKVLIDRGTIAESSRRNIDVIVWYKRLINVTLGLLAASSFFTVMSFLFALLQPLPELYSTSSDGGLKQVFFVRTQEDPGLALLRKSLVNEQVSRQELMVKTSIQKIAPAVDTNVSVPAPAIASTQQINR